MTMLIRRNGRELFPIPSVFENFFNEPFFSGAPLTARVDEGTLPLDVSEDDKHVIVRASLPGFRKDQVEVEVHDGVLTITARQEEEKEETTERYYRKERRVGSLSRRVALPGAVLEKESEAELKDGVLTLRLAKVQKEQPRKIRIN
jgi:HSP20 family protein